MPLAICHNPILALIIYNLHFVCDNYLVTSLDGHDKKVSVNAHGKIKRYDDGLSHPVS